MPDARAYYEAHWSKSGACWERDPTTPRRQALLLAALSRYVPKGERVLDLGCGIGRFSGAIAAAGYQVTGVDISSEAVEHARREQRGGDFHVLDDDGTIPIGSGSFAAVWSSEVVEHVLDIQLHVSEVNRVLRPGGTYILTTPFHGRIKNLLIVVLKFSGHFDPMGPHIRFFDKEGLRRYLSNGGLEPLSWRGIGRAWPLYRTWFVVSRKVTSPEPAPG